MEGWKKYGWKIRKYDISSEVHCKLTRRRRSNSIDVTGATL